MERQKNALIHEKSPYLLQHAGNPVDWLPWGKTALARAAREDKPIFLSIGYATCHWCHVMERECFQDEEVAALLNENFVCVKVDREERPDLDAAYMLACQAMTGGGGWPLNVMTTPQGGPFYAAAYIPKSSRLGRTGMTELIPKMGEIWKTRRREVEDRAAQVAGALSGAGGNVARAAGAMPGTMTWTQELDEAYHQLCGHFDTVWGGFGEAPKFPSPHNLLFLLRRFDHTGEPPALAMVERTLSSMRLGGIFDQIGMGFHRYSTDAMWRLPHFEKTLYDQAMLALAYVEAAQATGNPVFAQTAREILAYVTTDLALQGGGFASGEDADSQGEEGAFYLWRVKEIKEILNAPDADLFLAAFHFEELGNYADESGGLKTGRNIPYLAADLAQVAEKQGVAPDDLDERLDAVISKVSAARAQRQRPLRDNKILTGWNGLTIAALARAGAAFDDAHLLDAARRAAEFALSNLRDDQGKLLHRFIDGEAAIGGFFDDYAYFVWGLIELYQADFNPAWLETALRLTDESVARFRDEQGGGFFLTPHDGEQLFMRPKESQDGALPSGNSVAVDNLTRLGRLTGRQDYLDLAGKTAQAFGALVKAMPAGFTHLLACVDSLLRPAPSVTIAAKKSGPETQALLDAVRHSYVPGLTIRLLTQATAQALNKLAPDADPTPLEEHAAAYVRTKDAAVQVFHDPQALAKFLRGDRLN